MKLNIGEVHNWFFDNGLDGDLDIVCLSGVAYADVDVESVINYDSFGQESWLVLKRPSYFLRKNSKNEGASLSSEGLLVMVLVREYGEDAGDDNDAGESMN